MTNKPKLMQAVLYLRSSKDRSDVSIDAQRRELQRLAGERGYAVVDEYADVVESGKDDQRAAFQRLLKDLKTRDRLWSAVIVYDTSRIARRRHISVNFDHECQKLGITVIYRSMPDTDPATEVLLMSVTQGIDEWHSLVSKQKGLAGMAENVRQGYRAGGRAPYGYRLQPVGTGAIRDGHPVLKSRLERNDQSDQIARYLKLRAAGIKGSAAAQEVGIGLSRSTLTGIEWNALTYAGHTVWNVHNEYSPGGYAGGSKRRPRAAWIIQRDTHPALISDAEAEAILAQLSSSPHRQSRKRGGQYLLSGILKSPDGVPWHGEDKIYYRVARGNQYMKCDEVDEIVLEKIGQDLTSPAWVKAALSSTQKRLAPQHTEELGRLQKQRDGIAPRISRFLDMASELEHPKPILRKIDELERERDRLEGLIAKLTLADEASAGLANVSEAQVITMLRRLAYDVQQLPRENLKDLLAAMLERIVLDSHQHTVQLHYRIPLCRDNGASPRGFEPRLPP